MRHIPRFAEIMQAGRTTAIPRIGQHMENQAVTLYSMDYKKEIGRRIQRARLERDWTLSQLAQETGDLLTLKRINAYENGDRMPGPAEAVILGKALGVRPAYLMAIDDVQLPISLQEEALIRNWRTLNERDRMDFYRKVETSALQNRDPAIDLAVPRPATSAAPRHLKK